MVLACHPIVDKCRAAGSQFVLEFSVNSFCLCPGALPGCAVYSTLATTNKRRQDEENEDNDMWEGRPLARETKRAIPRRSARSITKRLDLTRAPRSAR